MTAPATLDGGPAARTERSFPALDGMRVLAATAVVLTHAAFWTGTDLSAPADRALARLDVGVAIFFVLSGFLLGRPFFEAAVEGRPAPRAAAYLWRRALRILPAYWVAVALALAFLPGNADATAGDWARHLLLLQIYDDRPDGEALTHLWSMCTEVSFYLVLPWLAAGLLRLAGRTWRPERLLAGLGGLALLSWLWVALAWQLQSFGSTLHLWLPAHLGWFAGGMALAVLTVSDPGWPVLRVARELASSLWTCWALAAALFWFACSPFAGPLGLDSPTWVEAVVKNALYLGIGVLLVGPLVLRARPHGATGLLMSGPPARALAEVSYGLFLFHMPVLVSAYYLLGWSPFTGPFSFVAVIAWLGGVALATAGYLLLERPARRLRSLVPASGPRRRSRRRAAGEPAPDGAHSETTTAASAVDASS
ncbi:acyltransferase [Blastococcus sp. TF02A-35]|nr:acyltransferase [Blastococcus sp. TF02A_35]